MKNVKFTAYAGIAFAVTALLVIPGEVGRPLASAPISEVAAYVNSHKGGLSWTLLLGSLSLPFWCLFVAGFGFVVPWNLLPSRYREWRTVMLIGAIGFATLVTASQAVLGTAIQRHWSDETVAVLLTVSGAFNPMASIFIAVFLVGAMNFLPSEIRLPYLGWSSVALSLLAVPPLVTLSLPTLAMAGFLGFVLMTVWVGAVSILILKKEKVDA